MTRWVAAGERRLNTGRRSRTSRAVPGYVDEAVAADRLVVQSFDAEALREHRHGLRTRVWTVNRPAHLRRAVDLAVDAVISDHPHRVRTLLQSGQHGAGREGDPAGTWQ